jgi:hypothetical protein
MPEYRAFIVGPDGHLSGFEEMVCDDDSKAIERAERLVDGHDVELWNGARVELTMPQRSRSVTDSSRRSIAVERCYAHHRAPRAGGIVSDGGTTMADQAT